MTIRQIILDTETTGIGAESGHRLIEIACVEMIDRETTGNTFQTYLNPERPVDEGAFRVHGISDAFLEDKPLFIDKVQSFIDFIAGAELIIHNAPFDVGFINAELKRIQWPHLLDHYATVLDTLILAKKKHPGQRNNLDALCKRYHVNNKARTYHGALLDAELLGLVYLAMTGGQETLFADAAHPRFVEVASSPTAQAIREHIPTKVIEPNAAEKEAHEAFIATLRKKSKAVLWENTSSC